MLHYTYIASSSKISQHYPFGMAIPSLSFALPNENDTYQNRYLYNGKEYQDDFGLNWYDYGARFYDAQIARWHGVDPLAEKYYFESPYIYVGNNPLFFLDPDGREKFKLFGSLTITQGKVGAKARVADIGLGGSIVPFGGSEMSIETSVTLDNTNGDIDVGVSGEHAVLSEGSITGTFGLLSGSETEKDVSGFSWNSSDGSNAVRQKESEISGSIVMFGEKTTKIETKDSSGKTNETKTENVNTLKLDISYEINLLIIGFEINFGVYAEEPK